MFKNLLKSKKEVATKSNVEKLNKDALKNVIGGTDGTTPATPTPDDAARVKSHSNQNNN